MTVMMMTDQWIKTTEPENVCIILQIFIFILQSVFVRFLLSICMLQVTYSQVNLQILRH
jgi:hypothetical protein